MPEIPTSTTHHAVCAAVAHHRQRRQATIHQLSARLRDLGHDIGPDDLRAIERGITIVTVDDLMALAVALEVSPTTLLAHVPDDHPGEAPLATAVPGDVSQAELIAWMQGRTKLDRESRIAWAEEQVERLQIRSAHHEDQTQAACAELNELGELGELALQEADMPPVQRLHDRVRDGQYALSQTDMAPGLRRAASRAATGHIEPLSRPSQIRTFRPPLFGPSNHTVAGPSHPGCPFRRVQPRPANPSGRSPRAKNPSIRGSSTHICLSRVSAYLAAVRAALSVHDLTSTHRPSYCAQ